VNGLVVFRYFAEGAKPDSELWLARKRNAVDLMETSSLRFFAELEDAGETFADRKLDPNEYAAGGGFPIRLRGTGVIGSICVSGYPDHVDDHQLIINTLAEYFA
ncbi:MAG: heme-binding protein, partial [Butyricicoccus sp.]